MIYRDALLLYRDGLTEPGNPPPPSLPQNGDTYTLMSFYFSDLPYALIYKYIYAFRLLQLLGYKNIISWNRPRFPLSPTLIHRPADPQRPQLSA